MTGSDSGSVPGPVHTVTDPRLAALLTDPVARRFYEPFLARTLSVSAAAQEVGCSLDAMLYRVRVFVRAGLLRVAEERPRKGRAIKLYQTVFPAYFVPHRVTPFTTVEDRLYAGAEPYFAPGPARRPGAYTPATFWAFGSTGTTSGRSGRSRRRTRRVWVGWRRTA